MNIIITIYAIILIIGIIPCMVIPMREKDEGDAGILAIECLSIYFIISLLLTFILIKIILEN